MSIYIHDNSEVFRLEVRGDLNDGDAREIVEMYKTASTTIAEAQLVIDMRNACQVSEAGAQALTFFHSLGAEFCHRQLNNSASSTRSVALRWLLAIGTLQWNNSQSKESRPGPIKNSTTLATK